MTLCTPDQPRMSMLGLRARRLASGAAVVSTAALGVLAGPAGAVPGTAPATAAAVLPVSTIEPSPAPTPSATQSASVDVIPVASTVPAAARSALAASPASTGAPVAPARPPVFPRPVDAGEATFPVSSGRTVRTSLEAPRAGGALVLRARDAGCAGDARAAVSLDGRSAGTIAIDRSSWKKYRVPVGVRSGSHVVEVRLRGDDGRRECEDVPSVGGVSVDDETEPPRDATPEPSTSPVAEPTPDATVEPEPSTSPDATGTATPDPTPDDFTPAVPDDAPVQPDAVSGVDPTAVAAPLTFGVGGGAKAAEPGTLASSLSELGVTTVRESWDVGDLGAEYGSPSVAGNGDLFADLAAQGMTVLPDLRVPEASWTAPNGRKVVTDWLTAWVAKFGTNGTYWANSTDAARAPVYVELGSEPYGDEDGWTGETFGGFVHAVVPAIRAANPDVKVIVPVDVSEASTAAVPAAGTPDDFIAAMYTGGFTNADADAFSVHLAATDPSGADPNDRHGFQRIETIHERLVAHGADTQPLWITELGTATHADADTAPAPGTATEADQAQRLADSIDRATGYGYVGAIFATALNDDRAYGASTVPEDFDGLVRADGTKKPAWTTFAGKIADAAAATPAAGATPDAGTTPAPGATLDPGTTPDAGATLDPGTTPDPGVSGTGATSPSTGGSGRTSPSAGGTVTPTTPAAPGAAQPPGQPQVVGPNPDLGNPAQPAKLLFAANFADGISEYRNKIHPERIRPVSDPVLGSSRSVLEFKVFPGDTGPTSNPRAQIETTYDFKSGEDRYFGFSYFFPTDFPTQLPSGGWITLGEQAYGPPFAGAGGTSLRVQNIVGGGGAELRWQRNGLYGWDIPWRGPKIADLRGRWVDVVQRIKLSPDPLVGFVELWMNTGSGWVQQKLAGRTRLQMSTYDQANNGGPNNSRLSLYYRSDIRGPLTLLHGSHRIASAGQGAFDLVAPRSYR